MVVLPQMLTGRSFQTKLDLDGDGVWATLESVAKIARQSPELPSFHEGEFMYMGAVHNERKRLTTSSVASRPISGLRRTRARALRIDA